MIVKLLGWGLAILFTALTAVKLSNEVERYRDGKECIFGPMGVLSWILFATSVFFFPYTIIVEGVSWVTMICGTLFVEYTITAFLDRGGAYE